MLLQPARRQTVLEVVKREVVETRAKRAKLKVVTLIRILLKKIARKMLARALMPSKLLLLLLPMHSRQPDVHSVARKVLCRRRWVVRKKTAVATLKRQRISFPLSLPRRNWLKKRK